MHLDRDIPVSFSEAKDERKNCPHCGKTFSKKSNLTKHLDYSCNKKPTVEETLDSRTRKHQTKGKKSTNANTKTVVAETPAGAATVEPPETLAMAEATRLDLFHFIASLKSSKEYRTYVQAVNEEQSKPFTPIELQEFVLLDMLIKDPFPSPTVVLFLKAGDIANVREVKSNDGSHYIITSSMYDVEGSLSKSMMQKLNFLAYNLHRSLGGTKPSVANLNQFYDEFVFIENGDRLLNFDRPLALFKRLSKCSLNVVENSFQ